MKADLFSTISVMFLFAVFTQRHNIKNGVEGERLSDVAT
jgi:hypothetical protein